jgi:hypothetical protein
MLLPEEDAEPGDGLLWVNPGIPVRQPEHTAKTITTINAAINNLAEILCMNWIFLKFIYMRCYSVLIFPENIHDEVMKL